MPARTNRKIGSSRRGFFPSDLLTFLFLLLPACDRPPSASSLREWTPADHHSADDDKLGARAAAQPQGRSGEGPQTDEKGGGDDTEQLVDLAWRQQCTSCHGPLGRGDGPMGPMLHAPDLGRSDWQAEVTDAEIAALIENGKDKMPKFDLPVPVVTGLVARIRQLREK